MKDSIDSAIEDIIRDKKVSEQAELLFLLEKNGVTISQATLSRRLKNLNFSKQNGFYTLSKGPSQVLNVISSQTGIIVIHTLPGFANGVAAVIDQWRDSSPEILGTLAGDDTVLVVVNSLEDAPKIEFTIKQYFEV
jgi:transcriptional regulator of arginine metabolism